MTRIIIAGDSWGAHSYERDYVHKDLKGFKWKPKKNYVLYPGPGYFISKLTDHEVITTADHGASNTEALDSLEKIVKSSDVVIFYKTGLLREVYKAHLANAHTHKSNDCEQDHNYYSDKFYSRCSTMPVKNFYLIGGCANIQMDQANRYNIPVLLPSITEWLFPEFTDNGFDPTFYWLEYQYSCDFFKKGVVQSYDKIEFWKKHPEDFYKKHPTVKTNKILADKIYGYITDKLD